MHHHISSHIPLLSIHFCPVFSAETDERTRFEVYYPPFEGAIEAGVASVMCSYNKINNVYSCENPTTLRELRSLGFEGFVMSDWGAAHSTSIAAGLDGITDAAKALGSQVTFDDGSCALRAAALAKTSDVVLVFVGTLSAEGSDRGSLSLDVGVDWHSQNALVAAVALAAGAKTAVVVTTPGAVLLPWSREVAAIVSNFMPGQQAGNAIADILFGHVNPSGKLPLTFPNHDNETDFSPAQYPGLPNPRVSFLVRNTGSLPGSEVAQLYLYFPEAAGEPLQLKGFQKTSTLAPGSAQEVSLLLRPRELSIWNNGEHRWMPVDGRFQVRIGSSSRDIRIKGEFFYGTQAFV
eukprot:g4155.t1